MNALSPWLFLILLALMLPVYIFSEYRVKSPWVRLALKAACSLLFVLAAFAAASGVRVAPWACPGWFLAAFALCAVGDVLLSWPGGGSFLPGLGAFLLAHCAFAAAFGLRWGFSPWDAAAYAALAGAALLTLLKAPGMDYGPAETPVAVYSLALSAMAAKALSGVWIRGSVGALLAASGGMLFYASDVVLAFILFNRKKPECLRAVNLVLYYVGQGLLAASLYC